jgi:carboxyl-terminal processing protease
MRRRLPLNGLIIALAAAAALLLTITHPSPEGIISLGMGEREVRAAPGQPVTELREKHNLTALKVFNRTLVRIRDNYVDPARIDPKKMLYAALDSVQFNVPEVLVESDRDNDLVTVVVNDKQQRFSTKDVDSPWRLSGKLKKIFRFIEANMNAGADLAEVEYAAVNGMLGTLDPHSLLLDPELAREMDVNTSGKFGGLGIVIGMRKRQLTVIRPMKGTPAAREGIRAGDHIVRINDEATETLTLQEAVDRMRGDPGTKVTIWVQRKGQDKASRFDITRDVIRVPSVDAKLLAKNVGYLRIKQFAGNTAREVEQHMADLRKQGAKAWVLDLRGNPGGLLEQAIQVADLFVDSGTIVTTVGGHEREPRRASRKSADTTSPVAVLVNGNSASASEIVAGALKNLDRATILGQTTFGKGSVQILYDNNDGSKLKLTIAQYLTPGDLSIQSLGIVPDIELQRMLVPKDNKTPNDRIRLLSTEHSYREKDLKAHLDSTYAKKGPTPTYTLSYLWEPPKVPESVTRDSDGDGEEEQVDDEEALLDTEEIIEDYQIDLARDLVATAGDASRKKVVKNARRILTQRRTEEQQKLAQALAKLGVDWSEPNRRPGDPKAQLRASFALKDGTSAIKAGETVQLVGTVTNTGQVPAHQVHARIKTDDFVFDETEFVFGKIDPGQTRSWTAHVKIPEEALNRLDVLNVQVREAREAKIEVSPLKFRIQAAEQPVFAYTHQLVDGGNGDGLVQLGEHHKLLVSIKNTGKGTARETTALLRNTSGDGVLVRKGRFELGELKPGQAKDLEFEVDVTRGLRERELVLEMTVYDSALRESVEEKLRYPVRDPSAGPVGEGGAIEVREQRVQLREGAAEDSQIVGWATRGTSFASDGKLGDWVRVQLAPGRPGFVKASDVRPGKRPRKPSFEARWQVTPPALSLNVPTYESGSASYTLRGVATDDTKVEDVFIFVSNREATIENRKVFYKSNRGAKNQTSLDFTSQIPLWPGSNLVTVVARENDDVKTAHVMYLYRAGDRQVASE